MYVTPSLNPSPRGRDLLSPSRAPFSSIVSISTGSTNGANNGGTKGARDTHLLITEPAGIRSAGFLFRTKQKNIPESLTDSGMNYLKLSGYAFAQHWTILFACEFLVRLETDLSKFLCLLKKFICSLREEFVEGCETNLALQEVLELTPVWFLAVE